MKNVAFSLIAVCLLGVGCKGTQKNEGPKLPPVAAAKPAVPVEIQRLLPKEQLDEKNAKAQARILEETLNREGGFAQRSVKTGE